jgi:hypothetical protein
VGKFNTKRVNVPKGKNYKHIPALRDCNAGFFLTFKKARIKDGFIKK